MSLQDPKTRIRIGVVRTVLVALCCFTPTLLGVVGLSALIGYLDVVLLPALTMSIGLTTYAFRRKRQADACRAPTGE